MIMGTPDNLQLLSEQEVLRKNGFRAARPEVFDRGGQDGGEKYE